MTAAGRSRGGELEGRVALVTGAAQGLGEAIARSLASAGAAVAILDRNADGAALAAARIAAEYRVSAIPIACDVADRAAVDAAVAATVAEFGRLDVLVNNAGISRVGAGTEDVTDADWHDSMAVMLHGTFYATRAAGRMMLEAGSGSIINVASIRGVLPRPERLPYATAKAAVLMMTRCTAGEWAGRGVRVNAILPGFQRTPMWDADVTAGLVDEPAFLAAVPMGRLGDPREVGELAAFLASDRAAYITGACITIDGGVTSNLP